MSDEKLSRMLQGNISSLQQALLFVSSKGYLGNIFTLMFHELYSPDPVVLETANPFKNAKSYFNDTLYLDFRKFALSDPFSVWVQKQREEQKVLAE